MNSMLGKKARRYKTNNMGIVIYGNKSKKKSKICFLKKDKPLFVLDATAIGS